MLAVSPCATTIGVPPSDDQLPCAAETVRGDDDATGAGDGAGGAETLGAGAADTPGGGASGCDSIFVLLAIFWRGAMVPTGVRSTGALALANGLEKGSPENRVASEQPVSSAAAAVASKKRNPMRSPGTCFGALITQPIQRHFVAVI